MEPIPTPILRSCSATEREEKADLGQITFPMRIICFCSSAPLASPLRVWTHDMFFMDDQVKLALHEVQGAQPVLVMITLFSWALFYSSSPFICALLLFTRLKMYQRKMESLCQKQQNPRSPLPIGRLRLQSFPLYLLAPGY